MFPCYKGVLLCHPVNLPYNMDCMHGLCAILSFCPLWSASFTCHKTLCKHLCVGFRVNESIQVDKRWTNSVGRWSDSIGRILKN